jgi:hypothetical protein
MKNLLLSLILLFAFSLSAQTLTEKNNQYFLVSEKDTFPSPHYKSAKLYRYLIEDYEHFVPQCANMEEIFEYTHWDKQTQLEYAAIYKAIVQKSVKYQKGFKRKKLDKMDSYFIQNQAFMQFYEQKSSSEKLVRDSLTLSQADIRDFLQGMEYIPYEFIADPKKCGNIFRHVIFFFDEKGEPCDSAKFCLTCSEYLFSSNLVQGANYRIVGNFKIWLKKRRVKYNEYDKGII